METLEIHSKDILVKWVNAPQDCIIDWQVKPLKKSINFAIYRKDAESDEEGVRGAVESLQKTATNLKNGTSEENISSSGSLGEEADKENRNRKQLPGTTTTGANGGSKGSFYAHTNFAGSSVSEVNVVADVQKPRQRGNSVGDNLTNSDLKLVKDYKKLVSGELVHGKCEVANGGVFAFVFDNSFSKTIMKKVLFTSRILIPNPKSKQIYRRALIIQTKEKFPSQKSAGADISTPYFNDEDTKIKDKEVYACVLLKKRRKKLQGYVQRFFLLNFKYGTLSYFRVKDNKLRGQMPVKQSVITANSRSRVIIIDSGMEIWCLKALNDHDFNESVDAFNRVKKSVLGYNFKKDHDPLDSASIVADLEKVAKNMNGLKFSHDAKTEVLLSSVLRASDEIENILDRVRILQRSFSKLSPLVDTQSIYSVSEYHDAVETMDPLNSVVFLEKPKKRFNADSEEESAQEDDEQEDEQQPVISESASSDTLTEDLDTRPMASPKGGKSLDLDDNDDTLYPLPLEHVQREYDIPECKHPVPSLLGFIRKNVGKDLSNISMPVDTNEPLSMLQKLAEMFEYSNIITNALDADCEESTGEGILRIASFAVSVLSNMRSKARCLRKPFTPLLGETYELVREDLGFRLISEKVIHKPAVFAVFVEARDWTLSYTVTPDQKYWGKSYEIINDGVCRLTIKATGEVFTWSQPRCLLKNLFTGERYTEPASDMVIRSSSGYDAVVEFSKPGVFSGRSEDVNITAIGPHKNVLPSSVTGKWTESLTLNTNSTEKLIWTTGELLPNSDNKYGFTKFAGTLNKVTDIERDNIPRTDTRLRPDIRIYEQGNVAKAEELKQKLEEEQRIRRKKLEVTGGKHEPLFFTYVKENHSSSGEWVYKRGPTSYWNRRERHFWEGLPSLW